MYFLVYGEVVWNYGSLEPSQWIAQAIEQKPGKIGLCYDKNLVNVNCSDIMLNSF